MSMTLERPPAPAPAAPAAPPESSRWAWIAVLLAPLVTIVALAVGFALEDTEWGELLALVLVAAPILGGFALGYRSASTGNGSAPFAAATATAAALFFAMFLIGANVIEFASDGTSLLVGAATAVVAFGVTAFGLSRVARRRRRGR